VLRATLDALVARDWPFSLPFLVTAVAAVARCAHVLNEDLFPPDSFHIIADFFDAPPFFWVGAPALTALMADVFEPNLRDSTALSTIAGHPVFPALAAALCPSREMMASALEARFPVSMGALASMAAVFWPNLPPNLPAADLAA